MIALPVTYSSWTETLQCHFVWPSIDLSHLAHSKPIKNSFYQIRVSINYELGLGAELCFCFFLLALTCFHTAGTTVISEAITGCVHKTQKAIHFSVRWASFCQIRLQVTGENLEDRTCGTKQNMSITSSIVKSSTEGCDAHTSWWKR